MGRVVLVCSLLCCLTTLGQAQLPSVNVFAGYSYLNADSGSGSRSSLNGWNGSAEFKVFPFFGLVADVSGHYGNAEPAPNGTCTGVIGVTCTATTLTANQYDFLFGPRVSFSAGKFRPFVHALAGAGILHENAPGSSISNTSLAYALGGGIDFRLAPLISWRIQGDALETRFFSSTQSNVRISTGIVVHF